MKRSNSTEIHPWGYSCRFRMSVKCLRAETSSGCPPGSIWGCPSGSTGAEIERAVDGGCTWWPGRLCSAPLTVFHTFTRPALPCRIPQQTVRSQPGHSRLPYPEGARRQPLAATCDRFASARVIAGVAKRLVHQTSAATPGRHQTQCGRAATTIGRMGRTVAKHTGITSNFCDRPA